MTPDPTKHGGACPACSEWYPTDAEDHLPSHVGADGEECCGTGCLPCPPLTWEPERQSPGEGR